MDDQVNDALEREKRLDDLATAYLKAQEAGQAPDRQALLASHPELAAELREFFADQDRLERMTAPLRPLLISTGVDGSSTPFPTQTVAEAAPLLPPPPRSFGGYTILAALGQGGMGVVWKARQKRPDRLVALKMFRVCDLASTSDVQRFRNEAEVIAQLDHPHILPVYDVGEYEGVHYFSMKLVEGGSLAAHLDSYRADPREAARMVATIARAVYYAHQRGILHRDLKPSNILLDGDRQPHVSDFGLAKRVESDDSLTQTGAIVGTPSYMAPEQTSGRKGAVTTATDVYGLGAVLYALLTGRPPFRGETVLETLEQVRDREPEPPGKSNPRMDRELEAICLKCLNKDPGRRYASAEALAEDLERWLRGEPVAARPAGWAERLARWMRRHRLAVGAAVCLLLALTAVAGSIGWVARDRAARRAEAEHRRAEAERVVTAAWEESLSWQEQRRSPEALSAARRAEGLLFGADVDEALRQRVRARVADLELLDRLENIRMHLEGADSLFGKTFRDAGLDIESLPAEEAVVRIRNSTVAVELAAVLDHWASIRRKILGLDDSSWRDLHRVARAVDPDDWRTQVRKALERKDQQALRALATSEEVFELAPATLTVLGSGLADDREARVPTEAFLRQAQRQYPNDFWLNHNLWKFFRTVQPPQREEALRWASVMVALRPHSVDARGFLGGALKEKGQLDAAIVEFRKALQLNKDHAGTHNNLGAALAEKGQVDEAIAELREAIKLEKDVFEYHFNLGNALSAKNLLDEAIEEYEETVRLKKDFAYGHYILGVKLVRKGRREEAIAEYREVIRLQNDFAEAYCNLGQMLELKGEIVEALIYRRRGHELGSKKPGWRYPSEQWVRRCERMAEVDAKLPAILSGQKQPADTAERLLLASMCQQPYKQLHAAAARYYTEAFAAKPQLADDMKAEYRFSAACAAALAGCGRGKDVDKLDGNELARLRQQALDWLRADLKAYRQALDKSANKAGPDIAQRLKDWLQNNDLAGVRGPEALAKLPEAERQAWSELWTEVANTQAKAQGKHVL
jgi:serine/threonine-protein kinase